MTMIEHQPNGDPCSTCGAPASKHRKRRASRKIYFEEYNQTKLRKEYRKTYDNREDVLAKKMERDKKRGPLNHPIIGIDGEGYSTDDGEHLYTYLAAVDENGKCWGEKWNSNGLTHDECCDLLLGLPRDSLKFGYMISYDMTKILQPLPAIDRYRLMRPDERKRRFCKDCKHSWNVVKSDCPKCGGSKIHELTTVVVWGKRGYNYQQGSYSFCEGQTEKGKKKGWQYSVKIWDCFRFFQGPFVDALDNWDVGTKEERDHIRSMKLQRGSFINVDPVEIKHYCKRECELLGKMMRKVLDAHEDVGLDLAGQFQGAGATASALLKKYEITKYKTPCFDALDREMQRAVMCAFFGGRFENSIVGVVKKPVWGYDIASAYPYAETFLPCLVCGYWEHVKGRGVMRAIEEASLACCHYRVADMSDRVRMQTAWMPLPYRDEKGSICYPCNCTGWAWKPEALSAIAGWGNHITIDEAWIYRTNCDHQPFSFIPQVYRERIKWGKEGKGIVLKLGANATYGKTAQNVGKKPFNDWIWAGNTTAQCRGQINNLICLYSDRWNALSIATDGLYGLEEIDTPKPVDTGTYGLLDPKGKPKEPLGGWEGKADPDGLFIAKPGLYFSLKEDIAQKDVRARGIGRRDTFEQREKLIDGFLQWDRENYEYHIELDTRRFCGIKNSVYAISRCTKCKTHWVGTGRKLCPQCGRSGDDTEVKMIQRDGVDVYGRWFDLKAKIRFDPRPKRERSLQKGKPYSRMFIRNLGGAESNIYKNAQLSPEATEEMEARDIALEQPDHIEE
jgi:predicted Zn-ribbon and HTH transcriptional regulator